MDYKKLNEITLKTPSDFKRLGSNLDQIIELITTTEYGGYWIKEELRHLFMMVGNMGFINEAFNKGVRVEIVNNKPVAQIYNWKEEQEKIDKTLENFNL